MKKVIYKKRKNIQFTNDHVIVFEEEAITAYYKNRLMEERGI